MNYSATDNMATCAICNGTGKTLRMGTTESVDCRFCDGRGGVPNKRAGEKENAMAKVKKGFDLVADCKFGNQTNGKSSSIGVKCTRQDVEHDDVERMFCGSQLQVELTCDPNAGRGDSAQGKFLDGDLEFAGVGEVGHYSAHPDAYGFRLSFPRAGIDVAKLARFAGCSGQISCSYVGKAKPSKDEPESGAEEAAA